MQQIHRYKHVFSTPFWGVSVAAVCALALIAGCGEDGSGDVNDAGCSGASCVDGGVTPVADGGPDAGEPVPDADIGIDAGPLLDAGPGGFPTLSDFRTCSSDTDCPVGLGGCVKELILNRDDGVTPLVLAMSDFDSRVAEGDGVCTKDCTADATVCETMSLQDSLGANVPFTCQLMRTGALLYPSPQPSFPFGTQIDLAEMASGVAFAALCRPPFELDPAHSDTFCASCTDASGCGSGDLCWRFDTNVPATGTEEGSCLEEEGAAGCPMGFVSNELFDAGASSLGMFCVPVADTCSDCQDRDSDQRGAGHCAFTDVDCDDLNSAAYFDAADPAHAFPTFCGEQDFNCNGLSDQTEQVGVEAYNAFHCEFCGDDADGQVANAGTVTEASLACTAGVVEVTSCAEPGQIHCSGDPRLTGCEATTASGGQTFYRDSDNDNFGDPTNTTLGCPSGGAPSGFVADNTDCNDSDILIFPGSVEVCDGVDNDCAGGIDDGVTLTFYLDFDADTYGDLANPTQACMVPANHVVNSADCNDDDSAINPGIAEICDGIDQNCNLSADEGVPLGGACTTGLLGICAAGTQTSCTTGVYECTQSNPAQLFDDPSTVADEDCDGAEQIIYVDPDNGSNTATGTQSQPMRTIQAGLDEAVATGASQVAVRNTSVSVATKLVMPSNIALVGGWTRVANVWTHSGSNRTTIQRPGAGLNSVGMGVESATNVVIAYINLSVEPSITAGANHYGLYLDGASNVLVKESNIEAGSGTDGVVEGTAGVDGVAGVSSPGLYFEGTRTCSLPNQSVNGGRGAVAGGSNAQPGNGDFSGAAGGNNSAGQDGGAQTQVASSGNPSRPRLSGGFWSNPVGGEAGNGLHGSGGGGGGYNTSIPAHGGGGGSGGCGGRRGGNGDAGGSSFGIIILGNSSGLAFEGSVGIRADGSGAGAAGGNGGDGGDGGDGANQPSSGNGGDGSGGGGGGGGSGGNAGSAYAVFEQGTTDLCSVLSGYSPTLGSLGTAGAGASAGVGGRVPTSSVQSTDGGPGLSGRDGIGLNCFHSQPCTNSSQCNLGAGQCVQNFCY